MLSAASPPPPNSRRAGSRPHMKVLDVGSGLGGPSRYLAGTFGRHVTGVDLAPDFVAIATMFTQKAGLADRVSFQAGDLTARSPRQAPAAY